MNLLYALALSVSAAPHVSELPVPGASSIVVAGVVRLPEPLGPRYTAAWHALASSLYDGTTELSRPQFLGLAGQAGAPLQIEAWPGLLAFRFAVPAGQMDVAGLLVEGLLSRAALADPAVEEALARLPGLSGPVERALGLAAPPRARATAADVRELYGLLRQPGRAFVCFGGAFEPGDALREVARREFASVRAPRLRRDDAPFPRDSGWGVEVARVPVGAWRAGDALGLASVVALGTGKGSAAHRGARMGGPGCYWVQSVLRPSADGWEGLVVGAKRSDGQGRLSVEVREALVKEVDGWTDADVARAVAVARQCVEGEFPQSPFLGFGGRPLGRSLGDRCLERALGDAYGDPHLPAYDWPAVSLEALKAESLRRLGL